MPATDSEVMEDPPTLGDKEGGSTNVLSSVPPTTEPSPAPLPPTTTRLNFTGETMIETKAVSMASKDCSSSVSSPAEASPAKPPVTSPVTFNGTVESSPATSLIASASDSLTCTGTSLVNASEPSPSLSELPSTTFGCSSPETNFPAALTFDGISVTLENNSVWKQFHRCGTEMILTKQGRRMFPYCRYRLAGLDPEQLYSLVLSIVPSDNHKYRWGASKWEVNGPAEIQQGLIRAFSHHHSPCRGSAWMSSLVSFYKLKLTNNPEDQDGHVLLQSMHRYIPRLHVIPVPDGVDVTANQPAVFGLESIAFTFPQTDFMAVTTYQNFRITQLKINHNPFAKGFREDGNNSRLIRFTTLAQPVVKTDAQPSPFKPAELDGVEEDVVDPSTKNHTAVSSSLSNEQEARLVLKPIMSSTGGKHEPYVPCIRGKHALGELVLVQKRPRAEPNEETHPVGETPTAQQDLVVAPGEKSTTPTSSTPSPRSSPGYRKRGRPRRRINGRLANPRGREWKAASAFPAAVHSPSLTVAMQPELDDVEDLLFVSFTTKEALESHIRDKPARDTSPASPTTTRMQSNQRVEVIPETDEEKMARLEAVLLQHFHVLKHRQVIHPVLQQVGLKLSSLDLNQPVNLQYLGVLLPLPPPEPPLEDNVTSPRDECLPFISRTGKTSDITKIKGWRNKFIRSKETSPSNGDGPQKNLSAFCSNMLDEYLESEGQYISERAAAFSTNPEGPVAYQLPAKSASYVKTLDSVLKQNAAAKVPVGASRPCPLSHKPASYYALTSSAPPPLAGAQSVRPSAFSHTQSEAAVRGNTAAGSDSISSVTQRLSTHHPGPGQRLEVSPGQSQAMTHRPTGLTKFQLKLFEMEVRALNEGLSRTQLTPDRLNVALSVILTKEMVPSQFIKMTQCPSGAAAPPACGQDFCRLGCVCPSLQCLHTGSLHCRRPECMFGCDCFKRKITKLLTAEEGEQDVPPVHSLTNMDQAVERRPGSHAQKLWNGKIDDVDPDPLFTPKSAPLGSVPAKVVKRKCVFRPAPPIREEDKDPVYRYLESMMTCARVREFNSKPPPVVTIEPKILDTPTQNTSAKTEKTAAAGDLPRMYYRTLQIFKSADKSSQGPASSETEARKQIEIQSECQWGKDRKKVLEALCRRLRQDRLCERFYIGPYRIKPVAKISMKKPSGSLVTYRIHISQPSQASDDDESDDGDEEKHDDKDLDWDPDAEEEGDQMEDPVMLSGVTPFLNRALPAGKLKAMTKPVGCQDAHGLIQVNDKSYNHARLLLGNIGSLHPANRLAAYVTGRLRAFTAISLKSSQRPDPANKINIPGILHIKAAGMVVPPTITARKTTELKPPTQQQVQVPQPDSSRYGGGASLQQSQRSSTINQGSVISPFQSGSTTSHVSLTVSPSLKTPSFLEQSGTYSFRICPPADQGAEGQNPPGVTLPGGFTLIQLPTHGADGATQQPATTTNTTVVDKAPSPKEDLCKVGHSAADSGANLRSLDIFTRVKELLSSGSSERGSSSGVLCAEKTDENNKANTTKADSNPVLASEDLSSDSSDYCGDEDEGVVDVETWEEESQGRALNKMREDARKTSGESRVFSDDFGPAMELSTQVGIVQSCAPPFEDLTGSGNKECKAKRRQTLHTELERQRRNEQRCLFYKLHTVLKCDPKTPRLHLLSKAQKEIKYLVETSKYLEEHKKKLIDIQSIYLKKLSLLTGKANWAIKHKLKEVYDRQKMRERKKKWVPFYSHLLQSRAALLQNTTSQSVTQSVTQSTPLFETDLHMDPSCPDTCTAAAQSRVDRTSVSSPPAGSSPAQVGVSNPQTEGKPQVPATPEATKANRDSRFILLKSSGTPQQALSLPLFRTKNGRIILPSNIKPNGRGYYTLMVVNPKKNRGKEELNIPNLDQQKSFVQSDHPTEGSPVSKDNAATSPNSAATRSGAKVQLARLVQRNRSISVPSVAPQGTKNSQESPVGLRTSTVPTSVEPNPDASPTPTSTVPTSVEPNPDASPTPTSTVPTSVEPNPVVSPAPIRRSRGRPRKHPIRPVVTENGKPAREGVGDGETSAPVAGSQSEKIASAATRGAVSDNPAPVKRRRGRPPSKKPALWRGGPSKSDQDSTVRFSSSFKSPDTTTTSAGHANASRPLTRGSLGKDFPSEKKLSWKDVEKDLEPELESE